MYSEGQEAAVEHSPELRDPARRYSTERSAARTYPEHPYARSVANPQPQNPFMDNQDLAGNARNAKSRLILPKKPVLTETGKQKTSLPWSRLANCNETEFT